MPEIDDACALGDEYPAFDCQAPLMTLPGLIPPDAIDHQPYLFASPPDHLDKKSGVLNIGIAWAGRARHEMDPHRHRSCPVEMFAPLANQPDYHVFSLQPDPRTVDLSGLGIRDLSTEINHFGDTAALVAGMDIIITVDTALAHLAGAMGKPGMVLLAYTADWRWRQAPGESSWYDSLNIYQQPSPGDWSTVFDHVLKAVSTLK